MIFHDLSNFDRDSISADICIVGSGPAGLSIARELANSALKVWIIESGGRDIEPETQELYKIENIGAPRSISQDLIRVRTYGGTSTLWSGRTTPYSPMDFKKRDWIPHSGWPIEREELEPYFPKAGEILGIGKINNGDDTWQMLGYPKPEPDITKNTLRSEFYQFSNSTTQEGQPTRFAHDCTPENSDNINILLHANLTRINTSESGNTIESIETQSLCHKRVTITTNRVILCCGGIENARLLLASNHQNPKGLGNENDMVGRFLADHPYCELGEFDSKENRKVDDFLGYFWDKDNPSSGILYQHGVALSDSTVEAEMLPNCAAYLVVDEEIDVSWHALKRCLSSLKSGNISRQTFRDLFAGLSQPGKIIDGFFRRYVKKRPYLIGSKRIALGCNVEQIPDPNSRVELSNRRDALGVPLSRINWKIDQREKQAIIRLAEIVTDIFSHPKLPTFKPADWIKNPDRLDNYMYDVAHHLGTTRMSKDPQEGVIDTNCQVHGISGLYVAGSSTFPTPGTANPMLMIVSLSLRLADHLKEICINDKKSDRES